MPFGSGSFQLRTTHPCTPPVEGTDFHRAPHGSFSRNHVEFVSNKKGQPSERKCWPCSFSSYNGGLANQTWKDSPQPQVVFTLGLLNLNPDAVRPST